MYRAPPALLPVVFLHDREAVALDPESGERRWRYVSPNIFVRMSFANDGVYLLDDACVLHCIDAFTGEVRGKVAIGGTFAGAMVTDGTRVFVATSHGVVALSAKGEVIWTHASSHASILNALPGLGVGSQIVQPDHL